MKKSNEIFISLQKVKTVSFCVSGAVASPGTYQVPGTMRIWDAIKAANIAGKGEAAPLQVSEYDLRAVRRMNRDSTASLDLLQFLLKGDLSQNPYVYPGDELFVFPAVRRVFLAGAIKGPLNNSFIPVRENEEAADFLSLFAFSSNADSGRILIQRPGDGDRRQTTTFDFRRRPAFPLHGDEVITVPIRMNNEEVFIVSVNGEVVRPGIYPIAKSATKAGEAIEQAGGYTSFANREKAVIIRRGKLPPTAAMQRADNPGELGEPISTVRPELGSALTMMAAAKDFSVIRIAENAGINLEPGDQIFIPRAEHVVFISGNVKRPGGYPFAPGKDKGYYIRCAGGFSEKADRSNVTVFTLYGDIYQTSIRGSIEDGDIIVVPMSQQYKFFSTVILPVLSVTLSTLSILLALYSTIGK
jgi:protein involved in polysaccharide export with SLBB domain